MNHIKKLFFVPVGLPGMGKSTLAKHIKLAVEKNLSDKNVQTQKQMIYEDKENPVNVASCLEKAFGKNSTSVSYSKVSYDRILGENLSAYQEQHPEVPFHEVIDIIRSKADQDYLD